VTGALWAERQAGVTTSTAQVSFTDGASSANIAAVEITPTSATVPTITNYYYDPFGQPVDPTTGVIGSALPDNSAGSFDDGWLGQHQKMTEHTGGLDLVQMGPGCTHLRSAAFSKSTPFLVGPRTSTTT